MRGEVPGLSVVVIINAAFRFFEFGIRTLGNSQQRVFELGFGNDGRRREHPPNRPRPRSATQAGAGVWSSGMIPALGAGGHRFDSGNAPVSAVGSEEHWRNGSASDSRPEGCVFESRMLQNTQGNRFCGLLV